jgi:hypothetical protein
VKNLDYENWQKLYNSIRHARLLTHNSTERAVTFEIDMLPEELDARTVTLLCLRSRNADSFYRRYLANYSGSDFIVLEFCQNIVLNLLGTEQISWRTALDIIVRGYQQGIVSERYAAHTFTRRTSQAQLPEDIAREILVNPERFPAFLVAVAETRYKNIVATSITPVGEIAFRDIWFES